VHGTVIVIGAGESLLYFKSSAVHVFGIVRRRLQLRLRLRMLRLLLLRLRLLLLLLRLRLHCGTSDIPRIFLGFRG
jgi:hypothetical protein